MRATGLDEGRINDTRDATTMAFELLRSRRPDEAVALLVAACAGTLAHLLTDAETGPVYARIVNGIPGASRFLREARAR